MKSRRKLPLNKIHFKWKVKGSRLYLYVAIKIPGALDTTIELSDNNTPGAKELMLKQAIEAILWVNMEFII